MADLELLKKLRSETGAGLADVKESLDTTNNNYEEAKEILRKKGATKAEKRAERETLQGVIGYYVHNNNQVAALIEVNCETDFVAKSEEFVSFAREMAMQVVAVNPRFVSSDEISEEVKADLRAEIDGDETLKSKPEAIKSKILESKLETFINENCLLNQSFFKDESKKIEDMVKALSAKVGEAVRIRRFVKVQIGE